MIDVTSGNRGGHTVIGSGAVARSTARALLAAGKRVRMVSRSGRGVEGASIVSADATDRIALEDALAGSAVVYQCAQPAYHRWPQEFPPLQAAVLAAATAAGADVVICDNLYGYGANPSTITEDSPIRPTSRKGTLRAELAEIALRHHEAGGPRVALLRPSNFFGADYPRGAKDVLAPAMRGKAMTCLGADDQPHSFSYLPDVGRAMATLGTSESGWGSAWIAPALPPVTQRQLAARVWQAAGNAGDPRLKILRPSAVRAIGIVSPTVRELREVLYEFTAPYIVDSSRFESTFSFVPTPLETAIEQAVREMDASSALASGPIRSDRCVTADRGRPEAR